MGTKTAKRLLVLVAVIVTLGVCAYLGRSFQVSRMAESMVTQAEKAESEGDYAKAVDLLRQHLGVVPDDADVKIKYADALLKLGDSAAFQAEAMQIYASILETQPNLDDIRRKLAVLSVGQQRFEMGQAHLSILLQKTPDDGELEFLMAQCQEALGKYEQAEHSYSNAITRLPDRIEIYAKKAGLLRNRLNQPEEADSVIESMVKAKPDDYRSFLARGRYRRSFDLANAESDFQKALQAKPDDPEIYVELARIAEQRANFPEARRILEDGLKKAGNSVGLYRALAELGQASNELDQAIADTRQGIKAFPEQFDLRWTLANMLIVKGDVEGLLEQIEELKRRNILPALTDYLKANHYILIRDWTKARQLLSRIQGDLDKFPALKAKSNELIAKCHGELGDADSQEAALRRAVAVDPNNLAARLELVQKLVNRGDINQAIEEYKKLIKDVPQVWNPLARLMIYRALYASTADQKSTADQNWGEIESLIDQAEKANPISADPSVMRAEMLLARGKVRDAQVVLERARQRFPKSVAAWVSLIGLTAFQLDAPAEGLKLLDQAKKELGDRVELRLEEARILTKKEEKGSEALAKAIEGLADNANAFPAAERRKLVEGLANEALRGRCNAVAVRLFSRCVEMDPTNLMIHWKLLSLAFQNNDRAGIERQIAKIKEIEGADHLMGSYADSWYLAWQADQPNQSAEAVQRLRNAARTVLDQLASRRPDWAVIPLAYATLEEQDLKAQTNEAARSQIRDSLVNHYLQAINGGQRDLTVVRRAIQLLFELKRYDAADQMLIKLPPASLEGLTPDLRIMSSLASDKRDFEQAIQIARKSVEANPDDFRERFWLAEILSRSGRLPDAEAELREAVRRAGSKLYDPWVVLVQFLTRTKQIEKAEAALNEAKATLPKDQLALAMAQGQENLAQAYADNGKREEAKQRSDDAKKWYLTAESEQPNDPRVRRLLAAYFLKNGQVAEVQTRLRAILQNPDKQEVAEVAWARRTLAITLLAAGDKAQAQKALELFKDREKTVTKPDDRRVLIQVLVAQKDKEHDAEAIAVSHELVDKNEASAEDRMLLAQLYRQANEWPKAQEQYRALIALQPGNKVCLSRYASELIARVNPGSAQEADEAEKLIDKLKQLEDDWMNSYTFTLQTELFKARGQADKAVALIKEAADRPNPQLGTLGLLSEKLGQPELAEQLLRRWEAQVKAKSPRAVLDVAAFLGRNERHKEAIDICEKAQADGISPEDVARVAVNALFTTKGDPAQILAQSNRVAELIEKGIKQNPQSPMLVVALGNVRERQQRYEDAIELYRRGIELGSKDGVPLNNLAWLTALRGGQGKTALDLINRAIDLNGPIPDFLDTRGVAYMVAGESRLAIEDLEKAVEADSSPSKLVHLAQAYSKAGDKQRARENLEKAKIKGLELNSLHPLEIEAYKRLVDELSKS